jgi:predicted alpha/beta superfamily hydrolase
VYLLPAIENATASHWLSQQYLVAQLMLNAHRQLERFLMTIWQDYRAQANNEHTVVGNLKLLQGVWSPQLSNRRDLLVHLPASYDLQNKRYPVIYMHDGQNLFDQATSFSGEWRVDETMEALGQTGLEAIVVGIPNMGAERCDEYSPFRDPRAGGGKGDQYLEFIIRTVKPLIDRDFRTLPDRSHTGIVGSSMGGLISLYAFFHYPKIFGFVGAMSPSLWFAKHAIFPYIRKARFVPGTIYLDVGTEEGANTLLDARQMHVLLLQKGYSSNKDLFYEEVQGAGHTESAWADRLHHPLSLMLRRLAKPTTRWFGNVTSRLRWFGTGKVPTDPGGASA